jgi:hypothetical protein
LLITELDEGDPGLQYLTGEVTAAGVVKASVMKEATDNELDKPREEVLSSTRDGTDAVINYVGSSTNQESQAYYKHPRTVRVILIKEQQQRSVHTVLDSFFKPALSCSKTRTSESIDEHITYMYRVFLS